MPSASPYIDEPSLVSIVITTYNRSHLVGRAIESALRQTYRHIEVIVIDDGSTDDSGEVLQQYADQDERIRIITLPHNQGVNAAKNTGLDAVSGPFATMLDSDDEFLPNAIETFIEMFGRFGSAYGMVVCNCVDADTGDWTGNGLTEDTDLSYDDALCLRMWGDFSGMWRTALVADLRFRPGQGAQESLVWDQVYRRAKVRYQHTAVLRYYRSTPGSVTSITFDKKSNRAIVQADLSYLDVYEHDIAALCPQRLAKLYRVLVLHATLAGDRRLASRAALRAVRSHVGPSTLSVLPIPLIPRTLLIPMLRRYFGGTGSKFE